MDQVDSIFSDAPFNHQTVYVVGHRAPDNDAVCSAVGMAYLKNRLANTTNHRPCVIETITQQTRFVLENYFLDPPDPAAIKPTILSNLHYRVGDAMNREVKTLDANTFLKEALEFLAEHELTSAPVLRDGRFIGIYSLRGENSVSFLRLNVEHFLGLLLTSQDILRRFDSHVVVQPESISLEIGSQIRVDTGRPDFLDHSGDVVISGGDDQRLVDIAERCRPPIMIAAERDSAPAALVEQAARNHDVAFVVSPHSIFSTCDLLLGSICVEHLIDEDCTVLYESDLLRDVDSVIKDTGYSIPVLDDDLNLVGLISDKEIIAPYRKPVILVDHSEIAQAVPGIEDCELNAVVDHHRLGDIESLFPIEIVTAPVGSTSTVVTDLFHKHGLVPPKEVAAVMLSSILSDTLILNSPTTAAADRNAAKFLADISGLDIEEFGMQILEKNDLLAAFSDELIAVNDLICHDYKEFSILDLKFAVCQVETVASNRVDKVAEVLQGALDEKQRAGLAFCALMLTDVIDKRTFLFCSNRDRTIVEDTFGVIGNSYLVLENFVSRKLQMIPPLLNAIRKMHRN